MPIYVWLILAAVFIVIEIFTAGFFIACFAVGALVAGAVSYFSPASLMIQTLLFVVVSLALIPLARLIGRKMGDDKVVQPGADSLIGKKALVIEEIDAVTGKGQVRYENDSWRAVAESRIPAGVSVKITGLRGAMLIVEKTEGEA